MLIVNIMGRNFCVRDKWNDLQERLPNMKCKADAAMRGTVSADVALTHKHAHSHIYVHIYIYIYIHAHVWHMLQADGLVYKLCTLIYTLGDFWASA